MKNMLPKGTAVPTPVTDKNKTVVLVFSKVVLSY
jgi:hypothetical protein